MPKSSEQIFIDKCREFERLYGEGRIEECVERFYAPDAILEGSGLPAQVGRKMIRRLYEDVLARYERIEIAMDAFVVSDAIAYCRQTNTNHCHDGTIERHKGVMIWNFVDGEWLVKIDLFYFLGDDRHDDLPFVDRISEVRHASGRFPGLY